MPSSCRSRGSADLEFLEMCHNNILDFGESTSPLTLILSVFDLSFFFLNIFLCSAAHGVNKWP